MSLVTQITAALSAIGTDIRGALTRITTLENTPATGPTAGEVKTLYESNGNTNAFTDTEKTKVGRITVSSAVNLDTISSTVAGLGGVLLLKGTWSAATAFPSGTKAGWSYIVSVAGTRDGVDFEIGDRLISIVDSASTTVYANNWFKADGSDKVASVNGRVGAVVGLQEASSIGDTAHNFLSDYTTARDA